MIRPQLGNLHSDVRSCVEEGGRSCVEEGGRSCVEEGGWSCVVRPFEFRYVLLNYKCWARF